MGNRSLHRFLPGNSDEQPCAVEIRPSTRQPGVLSASWRLMICQTEGPLVVKVISGIILTYVWIVISHAKDPY